MTTAKYFAPKLLARFGRGFPGTRDQARGQQPRFGDRAVVANEVDLAIMGRSPQTLESRGTVRRESVRHHCRARTIRSAARRANDGRNGGAGKFHRAGTGSGTRMAMQQFFEEHGLACRSRMEMASNETIKQAVMAGMGVSFISRHTIDLEIQTRRLIVLDVRGTPVIRQWHVAHLAKKRLSPTAIAFKKFVLEHGRALLQAQDPEYQ